MVVRGDAEYVRSACLASLERLDLDYIDLYYQHRVDTTVPIEVTVLTLTYFIALRECHQIRRSLNHRLKRIIMWNL